MFPQASPMCQAQYWDLELLLSLGPSRSPLWRDRCDPTGQHLPKFSQIRILICIWRFLLFLFSHLVMSNSLQSREFQHARLPSLSLSPRVSSNSCALSRWCHPTILSSANPLLLLPSIFPSIRVFSNESALYHHVAKVLELQPQHQLFQGIFKIDSL